jgi:ankyrin repeat protein
MRVKAFGWVGGCVASLLWVATAAAARSVPLVDAVKSGDREAVRALLKAHVDVNTPQPDGATALHWAAHRDDLETTGLLIRGGAHVNATNDYGVTPLSLACTNGNAGIVKALLDAGANPNSASPTGETVLMTAARTGRADVVKSLLDRGADLSARENLLGQTALMWAAAEGHAEVVRTLLAHRADARGGSKTGFTPLMFTARKGDVATGRILLDGGADINAALHDGTTALVVSVLRANTAFTKFLLEHGANPNAGPGFTPLQWAAGNDWSGRVLAENTEWSAPIGLRGQAKLDVVAMLLDHGADANARAERDPQGALRQTNTKNQGTDTASRGALLGATPFLIAARIGDAAVMRLLVARGADPLIGTVQRTTPLMMAAGADERGRDAGSLEPVLESSALEAAKVCVELGADVNAVDAIGNTALHSAAWRAAKGGNALIQFLLEQGANINAEDRQGQTALFIVEGIQTTTIRTHSPSTVALLQQWGAEPTPAAKALEREQGTGGTAGARKTAPK